MEYKEEGEVLLETEEEEEDQKKGRKAEERGRMKRKRRNLQLEVAHIEGLKLKPVYLLKPPKSCSFFLLWGHLLFLEQLTPGVS